MKKIIGILIMVFSCTYAFSQVFPSDIPTIEALVNGHKGVYKGLTTRRNQEATNMLLGVNVTELNKDYEELKKKTSKRLANGYSYLIFAQDVISINTTLYNITPLLSEYVSFVTSNAIKHPAILKYYYNSYKGIKEEIDKCRQLVLYGNLFKVTHKQQHDFLMEIKASLNIIEYSIRRTLFLSQGIVGLNFSYSKSFKELMADEAFKSAAKSTADNIIEQFKQK